MKKFMIVYLPVFALIFFTTSCSQKPSMVEFKGYTFYGRNYYRYDDNKDINRVSNRRNLRKVQEIRESEEIKSERENIKETAKKESGCSFEDEIEVKSGDTLYGLAIENDISAKKLIELNNLEKPYMLKVGQKLRTNSFPTYHVVKKGENLSMISNRYGLKITELAQVNDLHEPYLLKTSQKLKLPQNQICKNNAIKETEKGETKTAINNEKSPIEIKPKHKKNTFIWPVRGKVISKFGPKEGNLFNDGINISSPKGTEFKSTEDGIVAYVGNELKGYGNLIIIKHSNNWISAYAHSDEILIGRGQEVKKGQVIGKVGTSGNVQRPQLYFGIRKGRKALDPMKYLQ